MNNEEFIKNNITVLYVEDEKSVRDEITLILQEMVAKVITAEDGEEGLKKFKENKIDLIVTDVNMPKLSGIEMLQAIRKLNQDVPAIILSAYSNSEFIREANKIDIVNEYLLKPINALLLFEIIKKNVKKIFQNRENKRLLKLLEQYQLVVDDNLTISKTDKDGNITYANKKFSEMSGYTQEELIGNSHNIIRSPSMPKEFFEDIWNTILKEKKTWKGKIKNRAKNQSEYIVDATIVPLLSKDGEVEEFISLRSDITELEAYKELLKKQLTNSEKNLESKIHLINEYEKTLEISTVFLRINLNQNISYCNNKFLEISKYKDENIIDQPFLNTIDKSKTTKNETIWKELLSKGIWEGVITHKRDDDTLFYLDYTFRKIKNIDGETVEFMAIGKDITETISLHMEIEETQKDVIFTLGTIGEARSKETGNHVIRVAEYSYLLAKKLGLSEDDAQLIKLASPMHDIGKVGIPDNILNKPAKFTHEEFEVMKKHTTIGNDMLKNSNRKILRASAVIANEHHEKWNGKGYPKGLAGEEIHIFGRITAVADVFDALGSNRCYKKAWNLEKILKLFEDEKGKHFDPVIIDIFLDNLDEFLIIRDKYNDNFDEVELMR